MSVHAEDTSTEDTLADYFDGRSARPCRVRLVARGGELQLHEPLADGGSRLVMALPLTQVRWPERTRHGARVAHLSETAGGGELHALDAAGWDRFAAQAGRRESLVVRSQQSWRGVLVALGLLLAVLLAGWRWGVPLVAQTAVAMLPQEVDAEIGSLAFRSIEERWLKPSALPASQQAELRAAFAQALQRAEPGGVLPYRLEFRASRIGPNAFALPGGTMVMTDELVKLVDGQQDVIVGVLAHEYGHVKARHGMRQVVQAGVLGAVGSIAFGDYSGLLATLPALLGSLSYSRDFEREADDTAIAVLQASGRSPAAMVTFFERIAEGRKDKHGDAEDSALGIALSSHPADAERIARFRAAAAAR
jgi:Zn-dependent protease with chaperone function